MIAAIATQLPTPAIIELVRLAFGLGCAAGIFKAQERRELAVLLGGI